MIPSLCIGLVWDISGHSEQSCLYEIQSQMESLHLTNKDEVLLLLRHPVGTQPPMTIGGHIQQWCESKSITCNAFVSELSAETDSLTQLHTLCRNHSEKQNILCLNHHMRLGGNTEKLRSFLSSNHDSHSNNTDTDTDLDLCYSLWVEHDSSPTSHVNQSTGDDVETDVEEVRVTRTPLPLLFVYKTNSVLQTDTLVVSASTCIPYDVMYVKQTVSDTEYSSVEETKQYMHNVYESNPTILNLVWVLLYDYHTCDYESLHTYASMFLGYSGDTVYGFMCRVLLFLSNLKTGREIPQEWIGRLWDMYHTHNTLEPIVMMMEYYLLHQQWTMIPSVKSILMDVEPERRSMNIPNTLTCFQIVSDTTYKRWKLLRRLVTSTDNPDKNHLYTVTQQLLKSSFSIQRKQFYTYKQLELTSSMVFWERVPKKQLVVIHHTTPYEWVGDIDAVPMRSMERSVVHLTHEFTKIGYHCIVCCNTPTSQTIHDVEYLPVNDFHSIVNQYSVHLLLYVNQTSDLYNGPSVKMVYIWDQSYSHSNSGVVSPISYESIGEYEFVKGIVVASRDHKYRVLETLPNSHHSLVTVIPNGMNEYSYLRRSCKTIPYRFLYVEEYETSEFLQTLVSIFPNIHSAYPDASLIILSDWVSDEMLGVCAKYDYIHVLPIPRERDFAKHIIESQFWIDVPKKVGFHHPLTLEMMSGKTACIVPAWCLPLCASEVSNHHTITFHDQTETMRELILSVLEEITGDSVKTDSLLSKVKGCYSYSIEQTWVASCELWETMISETNTKLMKTDVVVRFTDNNQDSISFLYATLNKPNPHLEKICLRGDVYPRVTEWLLTNVTPRTTFLEIGCFTGYYSMLMSYKANRVFSYDIHPFYTDMLAQTKERAGRTNLFVHRLGLDNKHTYRSMTPLLSRRPTESVLERTHESGSDAVEPNVSASHTNVRCDTLDRIFRDRYDSFHHPLILKLDVNGSEPYVLEGGKWFLETYKPFVLLKKEYVDTLLPSYRSQHIPNVKVNDLDENGYVVLSY